MKNPAVSAEQYGAAQAVLSGRSSIMPVSVARELVDSTPERKRREFARALAKRRNPLEAAADLAEAWSGRPAKKVTEITEQLKTHGVLTDLGAMECLEIVDPRDERYVIPIKFGRGVRLASSEDGRQLYLVGGDQRVDVEPFGIEMDKDSVVLGQAHAITYCTAKHHLGKADKTPGPYRHVFADEGGEGPMVTYDCLNHLVNFHGGTYEIKRDMDHGRHSAGIRN